MRIGTCSRWFVSALVIACLAACGSSEVSGARSSLSPQAKGLAGFPPAVVAFNHSSIVENVTQTTPNCWSPAGATIKPGHTVTFEPITFASCTTAVLIANATGISCELYWNGEKIAISNSPDALCLWSLNSTLREGVWTYQVLPTSGS
jgi:hypothetical protein